MPTILKEDTEANKKTEALALALFARAQQELRDTDEAYAMYTDDNPLDEFAATLLSRKIEPAFLSLEDAYTHLMRLYTEASNEPIRKEYKEHRKIYLIIAKDCNGALDKAKAEAIAAEKTRRAEEAAQEKARQDEEDARERARVDALEARRDRALERAKERAALNKKKKKTTGDGDDDEDGSESEEDDDPETGYHCRSLKVPEVKIPIFSGEYKSWHEFRDMFVAGVKNQRIPKVQKMNILRMHLDGVAKRTIEGLPITADGFDTAWSILIDRFDNDRELFRTYVRELEEFKGPVHESGDSPRALCDALTTFMANAVRIGGTKEFPYEAYIITQMERKLSAAARIRWYEEIDRLVKESSGSLDSSSAKLGQVKMEDFLGFLKRRGDFHDPSKGYSSEPKAHHQKKTEKKIKHQVNATTEGGKKCLHCKKNDHFMSGCPQFKALAVDDRRKVVQGARLCFNCLRLGHAAAACPSKYKCQTCKRDHHTLLHQEKKAEGTTAEDATGSNKEFANLTFTDNATTIFTTAIIEVQNGKGQWVQCRAMFDDGASPNCINQRCVDKLGLKAVNDGTSIVTITAPGGNQAAGVVPFKIRSRVHKDYMVNATAYVTNFNFAKMPQHKVSLSSLEFIKGLPLADPSFNIPGPIDILISSRIYMASIDLQAPRGDGSKGPIARSSRFGWFITGAIPHSPELESYVNVHQVNHIVHVGVDELLKRFWEVEEVEAPEYTVEEHKLCVEHFKGTHVLENGRFTVRLPFNGKKAKLGRSYDQAFNRFKSLERRLLSSSKAREATNDFMRKYEELGHMSVVPPEDLERKDPAVYLPHHAVIKESSTTTKHRQVFDASARTTTGVALNHALMVGPTRQAELVLRLVKFRCYAVAITGDISMMYRQIWVHPEDRDYQRILWRYSDKEDVKHYRLNTVTYGTASAPFIAVECLQTLGEVGKDSHPIGARAVKEDFYVDDLVTGAATAAEAIAVYEDVSALVKIGGFELRKWASNCPKVLEAIPPELRDVSPSIAFEDSSTKTLGIKWMHATDALKFDLELKEPRGSKTGWTKRSMASAIASVFDPLGLLAPVVIKLKMLLQQLWLVKIDWDDVVPEEVTEAFEEVYKDFDCLATCVIPRCVAPIMEGSTGLDIELHGFCDASEKAYGACIYVVCGNQSHLLISKTKVAPLKKLTIPRLELCAAVLLANVYRKIKDHLGFPVVKVTAWSDNTAVLHWINQELHRLHTFVCNRVSKINEVLPADLWHHVRTDDNPSDCASRGIMPSELAGHNLWWNGPSWLTSGEPWEELDWSKPDGDDEFKKELHTVNFTVKSESIVHHMKIINNSSKYWKMIRVRALISRVARAKSFRVKVMTPYKPSELEEARLSLIKAVQLDTFAKELTSLEAGLVLAKRPLGSLAPFVSKTPEGQDERPADGLLRVGGRLVHSDLSLDQKYPVVLPGDSKFTKALVEEYHLMTLHGGPTMLRSLLGQNYWVVGARNLCRSVTRNCVVCFKVKREAAEQYMADLPAARVIGTKPFHHTGVDYGGPFLVKSRAGRGCKIDKGYIALFVCFATKAVHVEFVSSLSTAAFIAAFRRFTSVRGRPAVMQSDNGTNFVGAANEFDKLYQASDFQDVMAQEGIEWKTNVPAAPHHGGLWEAGIKQVKKHLARAFGDLPMTFEEWMTAVKQVEACLNSRPLTPLSSDAEDLQALTPGHFLIGCPLVSLPDSNVSGVVQNRLDCWQRVQQRMQHFWQRWREEYLSTLQQRPKWWLKKTIDVGTMVIMKEPSPPCNWKLGVIEEVYPGRDGVVRSVRLRTVGRSGPDKKRVFNYYDRPVTKICILPMDGDHPTKSDAAQGSVEGLQRGEDVAA